MTSELTYKVVAYQEIGQMNTNEYIDWAIEMIELGYDTPNLLMLASCDRPATYFEVEPYLKPAIKELGLKPLKGESGILSYSSFYIQKIADRENVRKNLYEIYNFCQTRDYEGVIYDFYLLYWAWDQIVYDDTNNNHYWEGVNKQNIEETVIQVAKRWIQKNKKNYTQQWLKNHIYPAG